jgi:hypothetical protein
LLGSREVLLKRKRGGASVTAIIAITEIMATGVATADITIGMTPVTTIGIRENTFVTVTTIITSQDTGITTEPATGTTITAIEEL